MSIATCNEPISWLRLERLHLGELDDAEGKTIRAHLASCPACAECLRQIEADGEPVSVSRPTEAKPARPKVAVLRFLPAAAALAAAAVALVVVRGGANNGSIERSDNRVKGSTVTLSLVREDGGRIEETMSFYRDGDTFKALVTCPPAMRAGWDLVVYENGQASFPVAPGDLTCGNDSPFPGAFRITGRERETVCLVWNEDGPVDRTQLDRSNPSMLAQARCVTLDPAE